MDIITLFWYDALPESFEDWLQDQYKRNLRIYSLTVLTKETTLETVKLGNMAPVTKTVERATKIVVIFTKIRPLEYP